MKALLTGGLCLALGLTTARAWTDEIQWRAAPSKTSARVTQTSHTENSGDNAGLSLSRPVPFEQPTLVRAKNDQDPTPRSLPLGPDGKPAHPPVIISTEPLKPTTPPGSDFIPPPPTGIPTAPMTTGPLPSHAGASVMISSDDCCDTTCCGIGGRLWGGILNLKRWLCHDNCCDPCCSTGPLCRDGWFSCGDCCPARPKLWVNASYLHWAFRKQDIPPLLSVINPPGAMPATMTLFDGNTLDNNFRNGGRFDFGFWFPRHSDWGIDVGFLFLGKETQVFNFTSSGAAGTPTVVRPVFDATTGAFNPLVVASPSPPFAIPQAGSFTVESFSRLWGLDADIRRKLWCGPRSWVDGLIGFKHLYLEEGLVITDIESPLSPTTGAALATFTVAERFRTLNEFNGPQIGLQGEIKFFRHWFAQWTTRVSLGTMHQTVDIDGSTTRVLPTGATAVAPGGVLALPTNIGRHNQDTFAVIPEAGIKIGYEFNEHWRAWIGYDFLYASSVVRPGDQIDVVVNRTQIPFSGSTLSGPARPAVLFRTTDFWTQGISAGLEYRW